MNIGNTKKSWSKYGGIGSKLLNLKDEWHCQACAEKMPRAIDPFLVPFDVEGIAKEYLRVCPACYNKVKNKHFTFYELVVTVRH